MIGQKQNALPDTTGIDVQNNSPSPQNGSNRNTPVSATTCGTRQSVWQWAVVLCLALSLVNVFILYILHFEHDAFPSTALTTKSIKDKGDNLISSTEDGSSPDKNDAISYNSKGQIMSGAGTTVYLKAGEYDKSVPLRYVYTAPIDPSQPSNTIMLTYATDTEGVLTTASVNADNEVTIAEPSDSNKVGATKIRGITTLSSSTAVVTIVKGFTDAYYAVATIDSSGDTVDVSLHADGLDASTTNTSTSNPIGRLSDTSFVTVYYDYYTDDPQLQNIMIGTVDTSENTIKFSDPLKFGQKSNMKKGLNTVFGNPIGVTVGDKGEAAFAVPWFTVYTEGNDTTKPEKTSLCVFVGKEGDGKPEKITETCNSAYEPKYRLDNGVVINEKNKIAFAFYDKKSRDGLVVIIAEITSHGVLFGEGYVVPGTSSPFNFGNYYAWSPSASVTLLSDNKLAVAFHDSASDGTPSTCTLSYSSSNRLTRASPVVPFTTSFVGMSHADTVSYSTTLSVQTFTNDRYLASYLGPFGTKVQAQASLVQSLNPAIGVISDKSGKKVSVSLQGQYEGLSDLKPGYTYYATTKGDIRGCDAHSSTVGSGAVLIDDEFIISDDAKIGIATDDDTLLLLPGHTQAALAA